VCVADSAQRDSKHYRIIQNALNCPRDVDLLFLIICPVTLLPFLSLSQRETQAQAGHFNYKQENKRETFIWAHIQYQTAVLIFRLTTRLLNSSLKNKVNLVAYVLEAILPPDDQIQIHKSFTQFPPKKWKFYHHLLTLMMFQTRKTFIYLQKHKWRYF